MSKYLQLLFLILAFVIILEKKSLAYAQDGDGDGDDAEEEEEEDEEDEDDEEFDGEQYAYLALQRTSPHFEKQTEAWEVVKNDDTLPAYKTLCDGKLYLGGDNLKPDEGYKYTFSFLPEHVTTYITVSVALIGPWATGDKIIVGLGEEQSVELALQSSISSGQCQDGGLDVVPLTLTMQSQHDAEDLEFSIKLSRVDDTANPTTQFAIREVKLLTSKGRISSAKTCFSAFAALPGLFETAKTCSCASNQYKNSQTGACEACHASCSTCRGPQETQCLTCPPGHAYDGKKCFACDSSCELCSGPDEDQCTTCPDGKYLYSELTCQSTCTMKSQDYQGDLFCSMCTDENTFIDEEEMDATLYYYPDDQTCKTICPKPYESRKMGSGAVCFIPLSKGTILEIRSTSEASSTSADVMTGGLVGVSVLESSDPGTANSGTLARMFEYTRYISVNHSPNLEVFYKSKRSVPGTVVIGPRMTNGTKNNFAYTKIPTIFTRYNVHSNFLVNFWDSLLTLLILSAVTLFVYGIQLVAQKRLAKFAQYFRMATLAIFGFLMSQFYNIYSDIILFSTIDFRSLVTGSALNWVSFFISVFFFCFALAVILLHAKLLRSYQRNKPKKRK